MVPVDPDPERTALNVAMELLMEGVLKKRRAEAAGDAAGLEHDDGSSAGPDNGPLSGST